MTSLLCKEPGHSGLPAERTSTAAACRGPAAPPSAGCGIPTVLGRPLPTPHPPAPRGHTGCPPRAVWPVTLLKHTHSEPQQLRHDSSPHRQVQSWVSAEQAGENLSMLVLEDTSLGCQDNLRGELAREQSQHRGVSAQWWTESSLGTPCEHLDPAMPEVRSPGFSMI